MELLLRRAVVDDARTISEINYRSWMATYRGLMPDELLDGQSVEQRVERQEGHLAPDDSPRASFLAERDEVALGYTSIGPERPASEEPGVGEVYAMYVLPEHVGGGVGRALMERATRELRARGFAVAVVWVLTANEVATRFYERAGFVREREDVKTFAGFDLASTRLRRAL